MFNTFGRIFQVTTWGESHGPALGATVDGVPPGVPIDEAMIQQWLDKRKPGQNKFTTQRREPDAVKILSGVYEGQTTGTTVQLMIENTDQRSKDYSEIAEKFRPGHADISYWQKYGIRDPRGGGRSSARETAARVAAGGLAREALAQIAPGIEIKGYMTRMGVHEIDRANIDWDQIDQNPFWTPDATAAETWASYLDGLRKSGSSVGAVIEVVVRGAPAGLGAPVYAKLDTDLAAAMMSINAVKSVEIGEGMAAATLTGEENADEISMGNDGPRFSSNHAGGILGGISTGQDIVLRFAVKPTSSILTTRQTITKAGEPAEIITKGRHDPCVGIRAVPVGEAMAACVILDHLMMQRAQTGQAGPRGTIGQMFSILGITFPIFAAIALGYILLRVRFLETSQLPILSKYVLNVALPALLFNAVAGRSLSEVFYLPFIGALLLAAAATLTVTYLWFLRTGPMRRAVAMMGSVVPNSAFVGFPLMSLVFPDEAGLILSLNVIVENIFLIPFLLGWMETARGAESAVKVNYAKVFLSVLKRPMIIGLILGLIVSMLNIPVPAPVDRLTTLFANSAAAVALLVIGGSLAGLPTKGNRVMAGQITSIKLVLYPAMVALSVTALRLVGVDFDGHLATAAILSAAMPSFAIYTVLTQGTGHDGLASLALLFGTVGSFVTINLLLFALT